MELHQEIEKLFRPLVGQRAWGAKVGWGSFVTVEFGARRLQHRHFHGDWHLWLYQCDWTLRSETHELANSESKKGMMQLAVENLNGAELAHVAFNPADMVTEFTFDRILRLRCQPYSDAEVDEECWMLFLPDKQVASLDARGLRFEPAQTPREEHGIGAQPAGATRQVRFQD